MWLNLMLKRVAVRSVERDCTLFTMVVRMNVREHMDEFEKM